MSSHEVLVVGGGGFLGRHVVQDLIAKHARVVVLGRRPLDSQQPFQEGVHYFQGDVNDPESLSLALKKASSVVYLAQTNYPGGGAASVEQEFEENVFRLTRLYKFLYKQDRLEKFVYVSSGGTVYGEPKRRIPISETSFEMPISTYGLTKLVAEHYLRMLLSDSHIQCFVLRVSNAYGEGQNLSRPQGAIGHFLKAAATNHAVHLYGGGAAIRDYVYAGDVADSISRCLFALGKNKGVLTYNVGSGIGHSLQAILHEVQLTTGVSLKVVNKPPRAFDCSYSVLNIQKISEQLGWVPKTTLKEGLEKQWKWTKDLLG
ncbi:MAG: NAD-dependent epimerase/dehydratase family protein [Pseudomonadota bacterium]